MEYINECYHIKLMETLKSILYNVNLVGYIETGRKDYEDFVDSSIHFIVGFPPPQTFVKS